MKRSLSGCLGCMQGVKHHSPILSHPSAPLLQFRYLSPTALFAFPCTPSFTSCMRAHKHTYYPKVTRLRQTKKQKTSAHGTEASRADAVDGAVARNCWTSKRRQTGKSQPPTQTGVCFTRTSAECFDKFSRPGFSHATPGVTC